MADHKHLVLFLSDGGNNLELMAESFARKMNKADIDFTSASMMPPKLNPIAQEVMLEKGMDISGLTPKTLVDIEPFMFDLIITLGDFDQTCSPNLPGMPPNFSWEVPDPDPGTDLKKIKDDLIIARDMLETRIKTLFDAGLLHALFVTRRNLELLLDNMIDGIMAHTTNRRIFFFNKAAEEITGFKREDIIGKDCHEVFPGRFCGGICDFCESVNQQKIKQVEDSDVIFNRVDGKTRILKMSIMPVSDSDNEGVGALISFKDETELRQLKSRIQHHHSIGGLIGRDPKMLELFEQIREVSNVLVPVLIEGESGTGKELVANAIHDTGPRAENPLVAINCGALPEGVLESELFGHEKGAFSGAVQERKGRFELADGGTIFLDEVGELSPAMQVKLLRVLQEQRFERVGGEESIQVDVRILSATNQNLRKMMEKKKFRRDLFYRLCVVPITLPTLRERRLDIPMLVEHFLELTALELKRPVLIPSNEVMDLLTGYSWPGNVRELHNAVGYIYVKCRAGIIEPGQLPPEIVNRESINPVKPGPSLKIKKEDILVALSKSEGNRKEAAKLLGIGRATLYRYLDHYSLK
jgi:PAS domain S-box-containing protein